MPPSLDTASLMLLAEKIQLMNAQAMRSKIETFSEPQIPAQFDLGNLSINQASVNLSRDASASSQTGDWKGVLEAAALASIGEWKGSSDAVAPPSLPFPLLAGVKEWSEGTQAGVGGSGATGPMVNQVAGEGVFKLSGMSGAAAAANDKSQDTANVS